MSINKKNILLHIILFSLILLSLSIHSRSSFFFPINPWHDVNCSLTIGRSMANGSILYKDIFEQRGPLFYFLHVIAYYIDPHGYKGLFFLEIVVQLFNYIILYRLFSFYQRRNTFYLIPFIFLTIFSSTSFSFGGSPEEICMPLLLLPFYLVLKSNTLKRPLSFYNSIIIGLCIGAVLWIKFSFLGFFIGGMISVTISYFLYNYRKILLHLSGIIVGIVIISLPIFAYFIKNHALNDLFHVYFYINLNYYSLNPTFVQRFYYIGNSLLLSICLNIAYWLFIIIGLIYVLYNNKKWNNSFVLNILFTFLSFFGLICSIFMSGKYYIYYSLILSIYSFIGLLVLPDFKYKKTGIITLSLTAFLISLLTFNLIITQNNEKNKPILQQNFANHMQANSTLLRYANLDEGFFIAADITPNVYYPWVCNILENEILSEQNKYIQEGKVDYIITERVDDINKADINHLYSVIYQENGFSLLKKKS